MVSRTLAATLLAAAATTAQAKTYFSDNFETDPIATKRWTESTWKGGDMGKFEWTSGDWHADASNKGIMTSEDMRWHAISAPMDTTLNTNDSDLVLQFSARNSKKEYAFCGGGYIKLLPKATDGATFGGDSPYSVMFGPDLCGYDISRIHAIFNYDGENMLKDDEVKLDYNEKDEYTHVYTLVLKKDGSYEILFDGNSKASGKVSEAWAFPSEKIDDPSDTKPADWVDAKTIDDVSVTKPEGYDDVPMEIADPDAAIPEDWDAEEDGEWEAPMVPNVEYKGPWVQPTIPNPEYKGEWSPAQITNDKYAPETYAKYSDIGAVGFELWTVNAGSIFDNVLVTDSEDEAKTARDAVLATAEAEKAAKEAWTELNKPEEIPEDDVEFGDDADFDDDADEIEVDVKTEL